MFENDFYPTPQALIDRMIDKVDMQRVETILEPSAGRGDIIERIKEHYRYDHSRLTIDAVELDPELSMILTGKGYKPVFVDFLKFETYRKYDLIIMNPPFSDGDKHLLHAVKMQRDGGQIVCLLNAETIRNPYTRLRQELVGLIEKYNGVIEYVADGFNGTEVARRTDVETALVYIDIPRTAPISDILKNLVEAQKLADDANNTAHEVVEGDYIYGAVRRYEVEVSAGLKLIGEYEALKPILSKSFTDKDRSMIELLVDGDKYANLRNTLVKCTRMKYWQQLFQSSEFSRLFTSKTQGDYMKRINDLARYEFNVSNIKQMQIEISQAMLGSLDDAIVRLFDEFSSQYWDEQSNNIHYYNGWKTNKAYIVNKKVITAHSAWSYDAYRPSWYDCSQKLLDIHKVFSYLNGTLSNDSGGLYTTLTMAEKWGKTRGIELPYCKVDFYKKGTTHITFNNDRLLKKFNLIGSQRKGWLPPAYGKTAYDDLQPEYRDIVDSFEGKESYAETVANHEFYTTHAKPVIGISAGSPVEALAAERSNALSMA